MTTLCTEAANSISTNQNGCRISTVDPSHSRRASPNAKTTLAQLFKAITQFFATRYNRRIDRQAFKNVLTLDDRTLKDIGVTRQDVKWASHLPLSEDAAIRLEQIARRRLHDYPKNCGL